MFRLVGFFLLVFGAMQLLRLVPGIGGLFRGLFGFWIAAAIVAGAVTWASAWIARERALTKRLRDLGHVDSAHNQGKLGALLLAHGRAARAIPPLERAADSEPDAPEWHYRLGNARLARGDAQGALAALERAAAIDEEFAYGEVQLRIARACLALGAHAAALTALERFDVNHGPSPESAYLGGRALAALGRKAEARASYAKVAVLAERGAQFQRGKHRGFVVRALFARLFA